MSVIFVSVSGVYLGYAALEFTAHYIITSDRSPQEEKTSYLPSVAIMCKRFLRPIDQVFQITIYVLVSLIYLFQFIIGDVIYIQQCLAFRNFYMRWKRGEGNNSLLPMSMASITGDLGDIFCFYCVLLSENVPNNVLTLAAITNSLKCSSHTVNLWLVQIMLNLADCITFGSSKSMHFGIWLFDYKPWL